MKMKIKVKSIVNNLDSKLVCKGISIEFSCVSLIQELFLYPTLRIKIITL